MPPVQLSAVASTSSRSLALASSRSVASSTRSGSTGENVSVSFKKSRPDPCLRREPAPCSDCSDAAIKEIIMTDPSKPQDGLQLLASDHRKVEGLFADFE